MRSSLDAIEGSSVPRRPPRRKRRGARPFEHPAHDPRPTARRDAAALVILVGARVRRSELAGLNREDLDMENGRILIRGKGRKERVAWLAPTGLPAVRDWLQVHGDQPGPLLNPVQKGGHLQERMRMTGENEDAR